MERKETYYRRRSAGLCVRCGKPNPGKRINCPDCLRLIREETRRREAAGVAYDKNNRRRGGKCPNCGKTPAAGKVNCPACLTKAKAKYDKRRADNLCVGCGSADPVDGSVRCGPCKLVYTARLAAYHEEQRLKVMRAYGGPVCACCGECQMEFLTIDHVHGGGNKHRKQTRNQTTAWIIKNKFPSGMFRVLCMNCNWAMGKYGYCPHKMPVHT